MSQIWDLKLIYNFNVILFLCTNVVCRLNVNVLSDVTSPSSTVPRALLARIHDQNTVASFSGLEYYPSVQQAFCTASNKGWEPLVK